MVDDTRRLAGSGEALPDRVLHLSRHVERDVAKLRRDVVGIETSLIGRIGELEERERAVVAEREERVAVLAALI